MRIKSTLAVLGIAACVVLSVLLPPAVSQMQDASLFGKITAEPETEFTAMEVELTTADRLALAMGGADVFSLPQYEGMMGLSLMDSTLEAGLTEYRKLQSQGIIPEFDTGVKEGNLKINYFLNSYTSKSKLNGMVQVWNIYCYSSRWEYGFDFSMDAETNQIYSFSFSNLPARKGFDYEGIPHRFFEYLGIPGDSFSESEKSPDGLLYTLEGGAVQYSFFRMEGPLTTVSLGLKKQ